MGLLSSRFLINIILVYLNIRSTVVSVPQHCSADDETRWRCIVNSNSDQIDCNQQQDEKTAEGVNIRLKLTETESNSDRDIFTAAEKCNIININIESNYIPSNRVISNLKSLKGLIIHSSEEYIPAIDIRIYDDFLFGLEQMEDLKIENFRIPLWGKGILKTCNLVKKIDLKNLGIQNIDFQSFISCKKMINLSIRHNKIWKLMISSFDGLNELTGLILLSNEIEEILTNGRSWNGLGKLTQLNLGSNRIRKLISRTFFGLNKLTELILKNNQLTSIDDGAFYGLNELQTINLEGNNKLTVIDIRIFSPMKQNLSILYLDTIFMQCIHNRGLLDEYKYNIKNIFLPVKACINQLEDLNINIPQTTKAIATSSNGFQNLLPNTHNLTLIVVLTVTITFLVSISIFFIIYCVFSRSKIRKYKASSTYNSCAYSQGHTGSFFLTDFHGTRSPNQTSDDGTYAVFGTNNKAQKSTSCSTLGI